MWSFGSRGGSAGWALARGGRLLFTGVAALLALTAFPAASSAEAIDPYKIIYRPITWQVIPIGGGEWKTPNFSGSRAGSSADARLPFEVTFFDKKYVEASIGSAGYITFGRRSEATSEGTPNYAAKRDSLPIPEKWQTPNRLLAAWWGWLDCRDPGTIRTQELGVAPHRKYIIEWRACWPYNPRGFQASGSINMQVWFTEGSATIEVRYGTNSLGTHPGNEGYRNTFSVGMMTDVPQGEFASTGLSPFTCSPTCGPSNWLTNTAIIYSQEPNLLVGSVKTHPVGYPGLALPITARVHNHGTRTAKDFGVRFFLSSSPTLGADAMLLGDATEATLSNGGSQQPLTPGRATLAERESATFSLEGVLAEDLPEGTWYVIAVADPDHEIPDVIRDDNVLPSDPILVGEGTADLAVGRITAPISVEPGATFHFDWLARNIGSDRALDVPYTVRLASGDAVSIVDRELGGGTLSLEAFEERELQNVPLNLPADIAPGSYRVGVIIDPENTITEVTKTNNDGVSEPFVVGSSSVEVLTSELPAAVLGAPFCKKLEAFGGDGLYAWSLVSGSELPPGLTFEISSDEGGRRSTSICGRPSALGSFSFVVRVESRGSASVKKLGLEVLESEAPLAVTTIELPIALFDRPLLYELGASGGAAPYEWSLRGGSLPQGISLRADGFLLGAPEQDGTFSFIVQVEDAKGQSVQASQQLVVASPTRLTCMTRRILQEVGAEYRGQPLRAAGGAAPYRWSTRTTRRLASGFGEPTTQLGAEPPPGLHLDADGAIAGAPTQVGRFLWTVELADSLHTQELCTIEVIVPNEQTLTVITGATIPAVVGHPYEATLEAAGGIGPYRWSLMTGSRLPAGLSLDPSGRLEGTPGEGDLGQESRKEYSFVVEARDAVGGRGIGPITLVLLSSPPEQLGSDGSSKSSSGSGCHSAAAAPTLLAALSLGLLPRRRRG